MSAWWQRPADAALRLGHPHQAACVRLVELRNGPEHGMRVLEFDAGPLRFDVLVDRAFDIGRCVWRDTPLGWVSHVGYRPPWVVGDDQLGLLRAFTGGLLTTAGLDHALGAAEEPAEGPDPHTSVRRYPLHGRLTTQPARLLSYGEDRDAHSWALRAEAVVEQSAVFGERLVMRRRVSVPVGGSTLLIEDVVRNAGTRPVSHMALYHVNVGWPLVDSGTRVVVASDGLLPLGRVVERPLEVGPPERSDGEAVYQSQPAADVDGRTTVALVNHALGLAFYQRYDTRALPFHLLWRFLEEGSYVIGLEPSTNRGAGRRDAARRGELIELAPGEQRRYRVELGVVEGTAAVDALEKQVADLREAR